MKNHKRKKKQKPQTQKNVDDKKASQGVVEAEEEKTKCCVLESLVDAFSLSSMKEAYMAYDIAGGDLDKASEILRKRGLVEKSEDSFSCFSSYSSYSGGSSGGGSSSSSSGLELGSKEREENCGVEGDVGCLKGGRQKKKVVAFASTGTVSTVLGKGYVRRNSASNSTSNNKGFSDNGGVFDMQEAEQFLCSMLGDDCDLNLGVVRDVLCQCGYDIEKALTILLELAGSKVEKSNPDRHPDYRVDNMDDERFLVDPNDNLIDRRSESTSLSSDGDLSDNIWSFGRKYAEVLSSSKANSAISPGCTEPDIPQNVSDIPQKLLESLFNIPKSTEHDKDTMNWKNVVKKIQSLGSGFNVSPHVAEPQQRSYAKGDEYHVFREDSNQHWDSVKSYYKKAATAYTKGDRAYAAYLSDQGREKTKLAQKADTKASHDIFVARNKDIENVITIDFHGQHVKQAMRMLKLHLLFGSYVPSVQTLRVITGCGSHGVGKSKLKQSVINLLDREAVEWREENRGTVLIKLNGWRDYNFVDSNSDNDSND